MDKLIGLNVSHEELLNRYDNVYIVSDTHFLHDKICEYADRPAEHNQMMAERWNAVVGENDLVIHVGDLSHGLYKYQFGEEILKEICLNLKGKKILVRGNHDRKDALYYKELGFGIVDFIKLNDMDTLINHYPPISTCDPQYVKQNQKQYSKQLLSQADFKYLIHGHQHTSSRPNHENCFNATVERIDYTPININEVFEKLGAKTKP